MPEGDTVRHLADRIEAVFAGRRVNRSVFRDPRLAGRDLAGATLTAADAYGKHLFVRFDDGRVLHAHLRMDGHFAVGRRSREPEWQRRIELWFDPGPLIGERVPVLELVDAAGEAAIVAELGPDLCAPDGSPEPTTVADRLRRDADTPLAGAMLDQTRAAGWGTVYANDVPFLMGVDPFQAVGTIDGLEELAAIGIDLIRANAASGVQNTTGRRLHTGATWVHGHGRRPCPVCGNRMDYRDASSTPWARSTTWCPACQPPAEHRAIADPVRARRLAALHPGLRGVRYRRPT